MKTFIMEIIALILLFCFFKQILAVVIFVVLFIGFLEPIWDKITSK